MRCGLELSRTWRCGRPVRMSAVCHMLARSRHAGGEMPSDKSSDRPGAGVSGLVRTAVAAVVGASVISGAPHAHGRTQNPALHGGHWMAVTGKPVAAAAGAKIF